MVVWVGFGKGVGGAFHVLTASTLKRAFFQPVYRIRGCKQHSGLETFLGSRYLPWVLYLFCVLLLMEFATGQGK